MLAITRRPGESFSVGDNIVVKIVWVRGQDVRLAIEAPRHVQICRDDAVKREPRLAGEVDEMGDTP